MIQAHFLDYAINVFFYQLLLATEYEQKFSLPALLQPNIVYGFQQCKNYAPPSHILLKVPDSSQTIEASSSPK